MGLTLCSEDHSTEPDVSCANRMIKLNAEATVKTPFFVATSFMMFQKFCLQPR
jgi:hypothetical protein